MHGINVHTQYTANEKFKQRMASARGHRTYNTTFPNLQAHEINLQASTSRAQHSMRIPIYHSSRKFCAKFSLQRAIRRSEEFHVKKMQLAERPYLVEHVGRKIQLRYVGLVCSCITQALPIIVRIGHEKEMCYDEIGPSAHVLNSTLNSISS